MSIYSVLDASSLNPHNSPENSPYFIKAHKAWVLHEIFKFTQIESVGAETLIFIYLTTTM